MNAHTKYRHLTICYFGINAPMLSPRDSVYLQGFEEMGVRVITCVDDSRGLSKYVALAKKYWAIRHQYDVLFVGHMSPVAAIVARLLCAKNIVFNALAPLYEGVINERMECSPYSIRGMRVWLTDFLSLNSATIVLVETEEQRRYTSRVFLVPLRKLVRVWTSVDPRVFFPDATVQKSTRFTAVFRGYVSPATGTEYILEAARILQDQDISFVLVVRGQLLTKLQKLVQQYSLNNVRLIIGRQDERTLRELLLSGHVSLGQFGAHQRLDRTIQFKTIETLALGMPYITGDTMSNRELLTDGKNCLFVKRASPQDIADKIMMLKNDPALRARLSEQARALYEQELTPPILAEHILNRISFLIPTNL